MVKLKRPVLYRGRLYKAGEPIHATGDMVEIWRKNGLIADDLQSTAQPETPEQSETPEQPAVIGRGSRKNK